MGIQLTKPVGSTQTAIQAIRADLATTLVSAGMPAKLYMVVSDKPIDGHDCLEGTASITQTDGRVMYNFGGKHAVNAVMGRLQGNFFLPKDGWTVDSATLKAYKDAKAAQLAAQQASKKTSK